MRNYILLYLLFITLNAFILDTFKDPFTDYPVYNGNDLGVTYSPNGTSFKVWAPKATKVKLRLYTSGIGGIEAATFILKQGDQGTWEYYVPKDILNNFYSFQVMQNGKWNIEGPDIYAKAVGVNGRRGMVVDLHKTDPPGWKSDQKPQLKEFNDIILYELHIRDISISKNSGIKNKGLFLGLVENGTLSPYGEKTGLDHLKDLGITHVHLLPSFDFNSIDETRPDLNKYNWGYDPLNYDVPEGSYSSNPYDGNVRIMEFKKMIQKLHSNGIRVILDVVYNHTADILHSNFNQFAPGYFYRQNEKGGYSDASGCGNETASERAMMRKYMVESLAYWASEYHMDGFRFDLMGIHDIQTMNIISDTLHKMDKSIFIYGEGWASGKSPLPESIRAVKGNTYLLKNIAAFNDDLRDAIKGGYSDAKSKGFVSGAPGFAESVKFGIVAATDHGGIDFGKVNYSKKAWAAEPFQTINYVSCHDDNTLFDKLMISNPTANENDMIKMDLLSNTIILTSQGVPFLHSGVEMLRTKKGFHNSYNLPDSINEIDWTRKTKYKKVFNYYRDMVHMRKAHPAFRMKSSEMIKKNLTFLEIEDPVIVSYVLSDHANGDTWKDIFVAFNGNPQKKSIRIPEGNWTAVLIGNEINEEGIRQVNGGNFEIDGTSSLILKRM